MLSAFMGFLNPGDEVIVFEPFFDQYSHLPCSKSPRAHSLTLFRYISNIEMAGGTVVYVPLRPPSNAGAQKSSAAEWAVDLKVLETAMTQRTKMIVSILRDALSCPSN
jgi:kynurenine aminotransferase